MLKKIVLTGLVCLLSVCVTGAERLAVPPSDAAPEGWTRIPYFETRPEFQPTEQETRRGFALFTRPLVDAIYPESRPGADERINALGFFAAWDQFQTLNFAVYPLRDLTGLRVTAGAFTCGEHVLAPENVRVRLVTYRDVRFPQYNSKDRKYRVLPEYSQDVTVTDAPAGVSQRYFLTFRVPQGQPGGVYVGEVEVRCDGLPEAVRLPVRLEVLPFTLLHDPSKHYSAYYYPPSRHQLVRSGQRDAAWAQEAMRKEFAVMRQYGFDRSPVLSMSFDMENRKFFIPGLEEWLQLLEENGMGGPIPVVGGGVTWVASRDFGTKFESHLRYDREPPAEFYENLRGYCKAWKQECDANGYPEMVFGPLDEVATESAPFGVGVYNAFHDAGLTTYTTKEPMDPSFVTYDPHVDIFASQVLLPRYEEVVLGHKKEYWCYPNHNSYERKDMVIMCKGGRMTYGFGFWRSGFDLLIPWIWRNGSPDHFNLESSGGANIFHPETGDMIMTTYWECFREGISDLRYLYTLENAVIQRETPTPTDPELCRELAASRALLQEIWDSIRVQDKYLSKDLWPSEQFDAYRQRLARQITALNAFPATCDAVAPSVIIEPRIIPQADETLENYERHLKDGTLRKLTVRPEACGPSEDEAHVEVVPSPDGALNAQCPRLTVTIDQKRDGSSAKGPYPSNWPALAASVQPGDFTRVRAVLLRVWVDSDRADEFRGKTPIHVGISPSALRHSFPGKIPEKQWVTLVLPMEENLYDGIQPTVAAPRSIRLTISEGNHHDGEVLRLYFDEISLLDWD